MHKNSPLILNCMLLVLLCSCNSNESSASYEGYFNSLDTAQAPQTPLVDAIRKIVINRKLAEDGIDKINKEYGNSVWDSNDEGVSVEFLSGYWDRSKINKKAVLPDFRKAQRIIYWMRNKNIRDFEMVGLIFFEDDKCQIFDGRVRPM